MQFRYLVLSIACILLVACASSKPIIYPNAYSRSVGAGQLEGDIAACGELASTAGANQGYGMAGKAAKRTVQGAGMGAATGAVGGAIAGNAGRGAAIGAASGATARLLQTLLGEKSQGNPAFRNYVTRCLVDRGYEVTGWN